MSITAGDFSETILENVEVCVGRARNPRVEMKIGGVTTADVSAGFGEPPRMRIGVRFKF